MVAGFSARVRFRSASTAIEPGDVHLIDDLATFMQAHTQTSVTCVTSRAPGEPAALAAQRGAALRSALVARQVSAARITTQTAGADGVAATCVAH
jgi:outer membrane protein OmpA-like peptidoglycan-associated protein